MKQTFLFFLLCFSLHASAANPEVEAIEKGVSPDGQFAVVNIGPRPERHFEIQTKSGETVFSQLSLSDLLSGDTENKFVFDGASKVLWRGDSRFVAIATRITKFTKRTVVLFRDNRKLTRVEIPEYEPFDRKHPELGPDDGTYCEPHRWLSNGDLVLDLSMGYHTKSEPGITGYFAQLHFAGNPPKAMKQGRTKTVDRD